MVNKGSNLEIIIEEASMKGRTIHPEIDATIDDGLKLIEHAKNVGITRQGVHYYLRQRGMHERWKQSRQALKLKEKQEADEKRQGLVQIVNLLKKRWLQLSTREGWAYQKAVEYLVLHKKSSIPLTLIVEFLNRYESALNREETYTIPELGQGLNVCSVVLYRILSELKLRTLNRSNVRKFISEDDKAIILRGANIPMSQGDLSYFMRLPKHVVWYYVRKKELPRPKVRSTIVNIEKEALTYRLASQIYEAKDLGFNNNEISELFDTLTEIVRYASKHKYQISNFIVTSLRTLHPDKSIKKPYLES